MIYSAGSLFNHFDGSVDLLDDLDDHYTAGTHKKERLKLILRLQNLAAEFSVRITILGGDVHLAALGRFYSNPKLGIPVIADHRYMANIISSAIVNKPPPQVSNTNSNVLKQATYSLRQLQTS
jgi:PhoD related phosphatase